MNADTLIETYPDYQDQIEHVEVVPEAEADTVPTEDYLPDRIADHLEHDLYIHQAEALDALDAGADICVSTSTSSGKTLIYALEIARRTSRRRSRSS